jgi:uncharacterized protein YbjT (DUF2867 family)
MLLVTGASGLSGSAIVREFVRQGVRVRALVRSPGKSAALLAMPNVEVLNGDMLRPDTLGPALDGVERALLLSGADITMLEAQCNFIDASKRAGISHVVKFSGAEAGFDPSKFRFTRMHEQIEDYLEQSKLAWTHLRPSQFMQVYLREAPTIAARGALVLPLAQVTLAPVAIEDIAQAVVALMRTDGHEGRSYAMTGPEALAMADIAEHISRAIGKPIRYVSISPEERRDNMLAAGAPPYLAEALYDQAVERLRNPHARVQLETHERLGLQPTRFAEFASRNAAAFARKP